MSSTAMIPSAMRLRIAANELPLPPVSEKHRLATALAIEGHCTSVADQRLLTEMLGLAPVPVTAPSEGERLRADRESAGLTITEAAAEAGISRGHLSNIEAGRRSVPDGFRRGTAGRRHR